MAISGPEEFGPTLRRSREQRGVSLLVIAERTNVDVELWAAMERNDFSRWPPGIFARAFIGEYAREIGLDPESTVNDFCRWFPLGDRRRTNIIRRKAELLGLRAEAYEAPPGQERRRNEPRPATIADDARRMALTRGWRLAAAGLDLAATAAAGIAIARLLHTQTLGSIGAVALAYYGTSLVVLGGSPGSAFVTACLRQSIRADLRAVAESAFVRVRRTASSPRTWIG
jgi:transcriptional regulator with XRE-family HTH domain